MVDSKIIFSSKILICLLNYLSFLINCFILPDQSILEEYQKYFYAKIGFSLVVHFLYLMEPFTKNEKSSKIMRKTCCFTPFFEALILINSEIVIYQSNGTLKWLSFLKSITIFHNFININCRDQEILHNNNSLFKYFASSLLIIICYVNLILVIGFHSILEIVPFILELMILLINVFIFNFITRKTGKTPKMYSKNNLSEYFDFFHEGLIIIKKTKKNSYVLEFCNEKVFLIFKDENLKKPTVPSIKYLDLKFKNYLFVKAKVIEEKEHDFKKKKTKENIKFQEKLLEFQNLNEILSFFDEEASTNEVFYFKHFIKSESEEFTHIRLSIHRKIQGKFDYFFLIIKKTDKIDELKEKNEIKSRLLSSFCHELKTPLNGSIPMLETLRDDPSISESIKIPYVVNSLCSLKLLDNSLSNILDYSLIISDQFIINTSEFKISSLLYEVFSIVQPQSKIKNLEINLEMDPKINDYHIFSDYTRLKQLMLNLILNAVQFTNKGYIIIKIQELQKIPLILEVCIRDTGIGFKNESLVKLKKKLKFGLESEHVNSTGSCMGLTLSNSLAILLGQTPLEINSEENKGTEIKFDVLSSHTEKEHKVNKLNSILEMPIPVHEKISKNSIKLNEKYKSIIEFSHNFNNIRQKRKLSSNNYIFSLQKLSFKSSEFNEIQENFPSNNNLEIYKAYDFNALLEKNNKSNMPDAILEKNDNTKKSKSFIHLKSQNEFQNILEKKDGNLKEINSKNMIHDEKISDLFLSSFEIFESYNLMPKNKSLQALQNEKAKFNEIPKKFFTKYKVLIVDDDVFNLLSLEMLFKSFNIQCIRAINGKEALEILKFKHYEKEGFEIKLIMMDYQMPELDGIECTIEIKKMINKKDIADIPIIGCTAFLTKNEVMKCFEAGMKDVVFKPLNKTIIDNIINQWL